jgi:hypothetical protein
MALAAELKCSVVLREKIVGQALPPAGSKFGKRREIIAK